MQANQVMQQAQQAIGVGDFDRAKNLLAPLHKKSPSDPQVNWLIADVFLAEGNGAKGVAFLQKAALRKGNQQMKEPLLEKAVDICAAEDLYNAGLECAMAWLKHNSASEKARFFVAKFLRAKKRYSESAAHFTKLVKLGSQNSSVHLHLAQAQLSMAEHKSSLENFRIASSLALGESDFDGWFVFATNAFPQLSEKEIFQEHINFGRRLEASYSPMEHQKPSKRPDKIRIAFISGDLRTHSVTFFLLPLLRGLDRTRFEVICYSDVQKEDAVSEQIKSLCNAWVETRSMDIERVAQQVQNDQIDLLFDLSAYTSSFRLGVFANKAAPIQVSYLGYPNTTGLSRMDYRLTDEWADPRSLTEHLHTESLVRLKGGFLCFEADAVAPPVSFVQRTKKSPGVCFGSFNAYHKFNDEVIAAWAKILLSVADSTLMIKSLSLIDPPLRERLKKQFASYGVSPKRLTLMPETPGRKEHLELYGKVDIHLDTFPYNGTTTTCEALWQGVPSVVIAGDAHRSRVGVSIMSQVSLEDFIADDVDGYVALAAAKAADLTALQTLREGMRERMQNSPLMQVDRFANDFGEAVDSMYQRYLDS